MISPSLPVGVLVEPSLPISIVAICVEYKLLSDVNEPSAVL
jgi:hypothetical protein